MAIVAELDCITAVVIDPTRTHLKRPQYVSGLNRENHSTKASLSLSGLMPSFMTDRPKKIMPIPRKNMDVNFTRSFLEKR